MVEREAAETGLDSYAGFLAEYPKTGPGTRGGDMLRRYWHPLCLSNDLKDLPYPVRMLGEDLVAFRTKEGKVGLLGARCPHRCASLEYGQIVADCIQCSYHGWTFDRTGHCTAMPLEPADTPLKAEIKQPWYPTQEWGGFVWCYMGPDKETPPPLPKLDLLARTDGTVTLQRGIILPGPDGAPVVVEPVDIRNYNYLAFLENFVDMGHIYALHMILPPDLPEDLRPYCDLSVDTDWHRTQHRAIETDWGIKAVVVHNTADAEVKFVNTFSVAMPFYYRFSGLGARQADFCDDRRESGGVIRIIDDEHFELIRVSLVREGNYRGRASSFYGKNEPGKPQTMAMRGALPAKPYDRRKYPAWEGNIVLEDLVIQESQGAIPPRESEHLATSDAGVALLRRIWRQSIANVANGLPPKTIVTDNAGVFEVDTFKGFAKPSDIQLGPRNMPSSRDGRGLIRDDAGRLVFA